MNAKRFRSAILGVQLACAPMLTSAMGLGEVVSQSMLGEPLRLGISVLASPGEEVRPECFRLESRSSGLGDDLPQLTLGRLALEQSATGHRLLVTTPRAVNEPVLRVALRAGCEPAAQLGRDYVILLDPPLGIDRPTAPAAAAASPMTAPVGVLAPRRPPDQSGLVTEDSPPPARAESRPRMDAGRAGRPVRAGATRTPSDPPGLISQRQSGPEGARLRLLQDEPSPSLATPPRLKLSGIMSEPGLDQANPLSEDARALLRAKQARIRATPDDQDLSVSVEAELVVLDKRLKELQATLDAAQSRIKSMESSESQSAAARPPAPKAPDSSWDYTDWFVSIALVAALGAIVVLVVRRRRHQADLDTPWPKALESVPEPAAVSPAPTLVAAVASDASAPSPEAPPRITPGLSYYQVGDVSHHLSVSELAQVTEEARVFLTLGHPDKAILALRDHVDSHADTAPAPWLMLLDLYRRTDNRGEYERSAAEFRHRYNAFIPPWDDPNAGQEGPGIEAYPHLVKQICDLWSSPTCKVFLDELLFDNRGGNRIGFNLGAYQDIMLLRGLLETPADSSPATAPEPSQKAAPPLTPVADLEFELDQDLLPATASRSVLETDHPGILERVTLNWGTPHVTHFLESLLFADHTAKSNFSEAALSELMLLHDVAVDLVDMPQGDHWEQDPSMGRKSARQ